MLETRPEDVLSQSRAYTQLSKAGILACCV